MSVEISTKVWDLYLFESGAELYLRLELLDIVLGSRTRSTRNVQYLSLPKIYNFCVSYVLSSLFGIRKPNELRICQSRVFFMAELRISVEY